MLTLSVGWRGYEVTFLQHLLNRYGADPYVTEDGNFGPLTRNAVIAFQHRCGVDPANGIVAPTTWQWFGPITERMHSITGYSQPTDQTCWSAAATMMTGTSASFGGGGASLGPGGGLQPQIDNVETFVRSLGWRLVNSASQPPIGYLINAVMRGPVWVVFRGQTAHAIVVSGVLHGYWHEISDTVFRIHDPWPPHARRVSIYGSAYNGGALMLHSVRPPQAGIVQYMAQP
jgi:hypothetical protein